MNQRRFRFGITATTLFAMAIPAFAQVDPGSTWPMFKSNAARKGSVTGVTGAAVTPAWTLSNVGNCAAGGITTGSNGSLYYKSNDGPEVYVYRLSMATGAIQAQSVNLSEAGAGTGSYSGVAVGVSEVYVCQSPTATLPTRIIVLDKSTLAILRTYTSAAFSSLRGTPLISTITDVNGHYTLYVADRGNNTLHAVDATDGTVRWTVNTNTAASLFGQCGPLWVTGNGKQAIAYFRNTAAFPGIAFEDNGDMSPPNLLWENGPDSFNWFGSGALSTDGTAIYVTTFNDGNVATLWKLDITNGNTIWSVPGNRGTPDERNYFSRPSVIGNRIYCGGGFGVVTCIVDEGATYSIAWEQRDTRGEITGITAVQTATGDTFVYGVAQSVFIGSVEQTYAEMRVLQDLGDHFCEVYRTSLGDTMKPTRFSANTPVPDAAGNVYVAGGIPSTTLPATGQVYRFSVGATAPCGACCFTDGTCEVTPSDMCPGLGGLFQGVGTDCDPAPCPPVGACCLPGGEGCIQTFEALCTAALGDYQGDGTFCVSYAATRAAVALEDIHTTGTPLGAGLPPEDASTTIPIGFTFNFFGNDYTDVRVNDNGYISFSGGEGPQSWVPDFGTVEPNDVVAVAWTDLSSRLPLASAEPNGVFYQNLTSPSRLVIQWHRVSTFTGNPTAVDESTFQVILYEGSNNIEIRWGSLDIFLVDTLAEAGLENIDGTRTQQVANAISGESQLFTYSGLCVAACPGERGDINCDGGIDFFDIDPFLLSLFDNPAYLATYCGGSNCAADVDCSGGVDFFDIDPFLACLFSTCPPCP